MEDVRWLGLKWCAVDFAGNRVHVCNNVLYSPDVGIYEDTPKTATSDRWVTLPAETMQLLRQYRAWQNAERLRLGEYYQDQGNIIKIRAFYSPRTMEIPCTRIA